MSAASAGFERAEALLRRAGASSGAAECHGFLAGCLCVMGAPERVLEIGMDYLLDGGSGHPGADTGAVRGLLQEILVRAHADLESDEPVFEPLLPGANHTPHEQVAALREWCIGFLGGLGHLDPKVYDGLAREQRDFLRDMTQITRVDERVEGDGAGTAGYIATLVGYLRAGAMRLYVRLRKG